MYVFPHLSPSPYAPQPCSPVYHLYPLPLYNYKKQDYGAEGSGAKSDAVYNMVKSMKVSSPSFLSFFI
jgi:hypothetical protein